MKKIYLVRHGEIEKDTQGKRYIGVTDVQLDSRGEDDAAKLGEYFSGIGSRYEVFMSPLQRCRKTAEIITERLSEITGQKQNNPRVENDFREIDLGEWDGKLISEIKTKYPDEYERRGKAIGSFHTPGGESFEEAGERFYKAMTEIRFTQGTEEESDIIVVSHAGVIRAFISKILGRKLDDLMVIPMPYGGITEILYSSDAYSSFRLADPVKTGFRPEEFLDMSEVERLWDKYSVPENVRRHMMGVSSAVEDILKELGIFDDRLMKAALLHDLCRTCPDHAKVSADAIVKEGYPEIAGLVALHHSTDIDKSEQGAHRVTQDEILFYADKIVQEDKRVTVEERFESSRKKCRTEEAINKHKKMYRKALLIREKIEKYRNREKFENETNGHQRRSWADALSRHYADNKG